MRVGVPKEIKNHEYRVGLTPSSVAELVAAGQEVVVETQAGAGIELHAKPGATVRGGEPLMTLHTDTPERFARALDALEDAVTVGPHGSRPAVGEVVPERVDRPLA